MDSSERVWRERGLHAAVLAGDEHAWSTLYADAFDGLYAYVRWRCAGLHDLADEIVQETWLVAVRRIRSFVPENGSFAGWLRGIAANMIRNHLRHKTSLNHREPIPVAVQASAEESLLRSEEAERIAHALAALPEHYEAVLRAKYLDGMRVSKIATEHGESSKAVESLLTRARAAFRDVYERRSK